MSTTLVKINIDAVVEEQGSLRSAARHLKVDPGHLSRVRSGKRDPGKRLAKQLGLKRVTTYVNS